MRNFLPALLALFLVCLPAPSYARGGGGCLEQGTPILTPHGWVAIENLAAGDEVFSFFDGHTEISAVLETIVVQSAQYFEITIGQLGLFEYTVRFTAEHPVAVAPGEFREAQTLALGDSVLAFHDQRLLTARVLKISKISATLPAYNLLVTPGGTFIAGGVLVHNKGCFLPDTPITLEDGSAMPISEIVAGMRVLALEGDDRVVAATVKSVLSREVPGYLVIKTSEHEVKVTSEHPFFVGKGEFRIASSLKPGDKVFVLTPLGLASEKVLGIQHFDEAVTVYNLQTDSPHTFFAHGIAVHNKGGGGGGGGGGGFRSSRGGSRGPPSPFVIFVFIVVAGAKMYFQQREAYSGELDHVFADSEIDPKARKTEKLIALIASQDAQFNSQELVARARMTFEKLQECWQTRSYDPMSKLLWPELYKQHCLQLAGMRRNHEINRIEGLNIQALRLVNIRYTHKPETREFTALISASARDYYVDDRDSSFLRGDTSAQRFQEFWVFQLFEGDWRLREVEQTLESSALKDENFFEQFTDRQVAQVYGESPEKGGAIGPAVNVREDTKARQTERMLNFLVQTDPAWNQQVIRDFGRDVFGKFMLAMEAGECGPELAALITPEMKAAFSQQLETWKQQKFQVEFRNFCIRKMEIVLVLNHADNSKDECVLRASYHAQEIWTQAGQQRHADAYVTGGERFLTLARQGKLWALTEIVGPAKGTDVIQMENVDEGSSADMLKWYYSKSRAN